MSIISDHPELAQVGVGGDHEYRSTAFNLRESSDRQSLESLLKSGRIREIIDPIDETIEDLFKIDFAFIEARSPEYAATLERYRQRYLAGRLADEVGLWHYLPWRQALIHLPSAEDYVKLRSNRNKYVTTAEEQAILATKTVGIAGLSVGSSAVNSLVLAGRFKQLRLADYDTLAITNLNRILGSVCDLGKSKALNMARRVTEIDPYQDLDLFTDGFQRDKMDDFFGITDSGRPKMDVFVEEMDSIRLKIEARFRARELGIPVVMGTDNGDNTIIDVERFDLDGAYPILHGAVDEAELRNIPEKLSLTQKASIALKIVGTDLSPRVQYSMPLIGAQLPGIPQTATGANLSGIAVCYVVQRILMGKAMPSGRYVVSLDEALDSTYNDADSIAARQQQKADFIQGFDVLLGGTND